MQITVVGWSRNMGATTIGDFQLNENKVEFANRISWEPTAKIEAGSINVQWGSSLSLTGDYRVNANFSDGDIAFLFRQQFGSSLTRTTLDDCQLTVSDELIRDRLKKMTLDQFFKLTQHPSTNSPQRMLSMSLDRLNLTDRTSNTLKKKGVRCIGDLIEITEGELLRTPNFGRKALNEVKELLTEMGLKLGTKTDELK